MSKLGYACLQLLLWNWSHVSRGRQRAAFWQPLVDVSLVLLADLWQKCNCLVEKHREQVGLHLTLDQSQSVAINQSKKIFEMLSCCAYIAHISSYFAASFEKSKLQSDTHKQAPTTVCFWASAHRGIIFQTSWHLSIFCTTAAIQIKGTTPLWSKSRIVHLLSSPTSLAP